jgi:hypothetical protein
VGLDVNIVCALAFVSAYLCTCTLICAQVCMRALEHTLCFMMLSATCIELLPNIGNMRFVTKKHILPLLIRC